jgi:hypothetical protein
MPTAPRQRRIVRRATLAVAVSAVSVLLYVASAITFEFACQAGWIAAAHRDATLPLYAPLNLYVMHDYPGSTFIVSAMKWGAEAGIRVQHGRP